MKWLQLCFLFCFALLLRAHPCSSLSYTYFVLACLKESWIVLGRELRCSWHCASHCWVVYIGLGLAEGLSEIDNCSVSWLSINCLTHLCSIWEIPASWVLFSSGRIQKISCQNPLQLECRHLNWIPAIRVTFDLEVRTWKTKGETHFAVKGGSRDFF